MGVQGPCPSCGATVEFGVTNSVVAVCESCSSVVGRGDGKLEDYGKVADLVQTDSPLQIGLTGKVKGTPFEVTGRTQIKHAAGGVWDEWYIAFSDGKKWGWLAEAQGKYYLTFKKKLPEGHHIPPVSELQIEDEIIVPGQGRMKVVEVGEATTVSAEGEIPFKFVPDERVVYADLVGPANKFATIDDSDTPTIYIGGEFPLERLGISEHAESREDGGAGATTLGVSCPQCGGALELSAPDQTERVACPYCDALLGLDEGNLKFFETLSQTKIKPTIPLGTEGELRGRKYKVIGFMRRKVRSEGIDYPWNEYLLYTPRQPFHWLVESNRHWTLGQPISAANVQAHVRTARYLGQTYRCFERSSPVVTHVYGEFYWQVRIGERVGAADYVRPPFMLSREETFSSPEPQPTQAPGPLIGPGPAGEEGPIKIDDDNFVTPQIIPPIMTAARPTAPKPTQAREVNYTHGEYIPVDEIEKAFSLQKLPRPVNVAPNQPFVSNRIYMTSLLMLGAAILVGLFIIVTSPRKQVISETFTVSATGQAETRFSKSFQMRGWRNIRLTVTTPERGKWAYVDGDLYNEDNGKVKPFTVAVSQSQAGTGRKRTKFLSSTRAGKYTLRVKFRFQPGSGTTAGTLPATTPGAPPSTVVAGATRHVTITIHQGVPRLRYLILLLVFLAIGPLIAAIRQGSFEARRWSESDFGAFSAE